jgi:lipopolysaccharide/colanic/teichoic acid biosynthesis glycosyltransferase
MDLQYMSQATFWSDMQLIGKTFLACVSPAPLPTPFQADPEQRDSKSMVA